MDGYGFTGTVQPVAPPRPWMDVPLEPFKRLPRHASERQPVSILRICVKDRYADLSKSAGYCNVRSCPMNGQGLDGTASPLSPTGLANQALVDARSSSTTQIEEKSLYQASQLCPDIRPDQSLRWVA